jgi:hypothetical protein
MESSESDSEEEKVNEEAIGEIKYDGSFENVYSGHCNIRTVKEG